MHVLVAHGNVRLAAQIAKALRAAHMTVDIAADGDMALRLCETSNYDVLIVAHELPGAHLSDISVALNKRRIDAGLILLPPGHGEDEPLDMAALLERVRSFDRRRK